MRENYARDKPRAVSSSENPVKANGEKPVGIRYRFRQRSAGLGI